MHKDFTLLSLVGVLALALTGCQAQADTSCGREGQDPCDDGCKATDLPGSLEELAEWYPGADNYVKAPKNYRQEEGKCTRCGNIYEPVCIVEGTPRCFIDAQAGVVMQPTEEGFCVPPQGIFGCGTTGLPPCPTALVQDYGTIAVLSPREDSEGWQLTASLGEIANDGCLYSTHNLVLRFVKAPADWLPEGHKCADVCVACGVPGHPACPVAEPECMRRVSEADQKMYRDGPTYRDEETNMCRALHCGSSTIEVDLPVCDPNDAVAQRVLTSVFSGEQVAPGFSTMLDADGDGCVEPYKASGGKCVPADATGSEPPAIQMREYDCSHEGMSLIDDRVIERVNQIIADPKEANASQGNAQDIEDRLTPILNNKGKCVECGRGGDLPCFGMDFDGCDAHAGFMLDQDIGLCVSAPCGGSNLGIKSPPWGSDACTVVTPTWYTNDTEHSPINHANGCLYFHNLITDDDGTKHCEPCGTPGNMCIEECIMGITFQPIGSSEKGLGEFQFLDDSIRTSGPLKSHCTPFPKTQVYSEACSEPSRVSASDDLGDLPPARIYSPLSSDTSEDDGYGTAKNPNECQHPVQSVERVYETTCPGSGGTPVSKMGQCGGKEYSGPTCCYGYSVCVRKSEFYSLCEGANVPYGLVPWHAPCEAADTCEVGSSCESSDNGSFCKPHAHHIPHSDSSSSSTTTGAAIGIALGVIAALAILVAGAFVYGQRRGMKKGQFKLGGNGWGDAESYATASNSTANKGSAPAGQSQSTYLDLAAATEAEALQNKRSVQSTIDLQDGTHNMSLPTSDFGIGRRA